MKYNIPFIICGIMIYGMATNLTPLPSRKIKHCEGNNDICMTILWSDNIIKKI